MTRRPDLPCAGDCGRMLWRSKTSLPAGQAMCNDCRRKRQPQPVGETQTFTCGSCGDEWSRPTVRGNRPRRCPDCRTRDLTGERCESPGCDGLVKRGCRFCSKRCAGATLFPKPERSTALVPLPWSERHPSPSVNVVAGSPGIWAQGNCPVCGAPFCRLSFNPATTATSCSPSCARRLQKDRYRARKVDAYRADVSRPTIAARDNWRCQLCGKAVHRTAMPPHPHAAVLDHILPLAAGGTHEPSNVQLAHFMCNSQKGDRPANDQLRLVG